MFVEDNHALLEPSTMDLTAEVLTDFFNLVTKEGNVGTERIAAMNEKGAPQRNIEVKNVACACFRGLQCSRAGNQM